jgi:hypothetical protein
LIQAASQSVPEPRVSELGPAATSLGFTIVTLAVTPVSSLGKSSCDRRQLQPNPVQPAELVPAYEKQTDAVGT